MSRKKDLIRNKRHKTEQEWLKLYSKFWKLFGNNMVRLKIGKFDDSIEGSWGKIEIVGYGISQNFNSLKKIIKICEEENLRISFDHYGKINIWENYKDIGDEHG